MNAKQTLLHAQMPILLMGSICLFWQLDAKSLWIDELFTTEVIHQATPLQIIGAVLATEGRPPLYYLMLHAWARIVGESDFALRFFSLFFAILCLPLTCLLAHRLWGTKQARTATALLAFSPLFLLYSRMARAYWMAVFLALLACYAFLCLGQRPTRLAWGAYLLASLALLYTDYMTASILIVPNLIMVIYWRKFRHLWKPWILVHLFLSIGFLPWMGVMLDQVARYQASGSLADLSQGLAGYMVKLAQPWLVFSVGETLYPWNPLALLALPAIGGLALYGLWLAWQARSPTGLFVILATVVPVLFTVFVVTGFLVRYMTFAWIGARTLQSLPFYLLLVANGLCALTRPWQRLIACIAIVAAFIAADLNYYAGREFLNPIYIIPSKEIAHQVWTQASSQDVILASRDSVLKRYYPEHHAQVFDESDLNALRSYLEITPVAQLWLVDVNRDRGGDIWPPEWSAWLQAHYQPVEKWGYAQMSPGYRRFKSWLTHRQAYQYKAELTLYRRRE